MTDNKQEQENQLIRLYQQSDDSKTKNEIFSVFKQNYWAMSKSELAKHRSYFIACTRELLLWQDMFENASLKAIDRALTEFNCDKHVMFSTWLAYAVRKEVKYELKAILSSNSVKPMLSVDSTLGKDAEDNDRPFIDKLVVASEQLPDELIIQSERLEFFKSIIAEMPKNWQLCIQLSMNKVSQKNMAEILGMSNQVAVSRMQERIRKHVLKQFLISKIDFDETYRDIKKISPKGTRKQRKPATQDVVRPKYTHFYTKEVQEMTTLEDIKNCEELTEREQQCLIGLINNKQVKQLAQDWGVSSDTIRWEIHNGRRKIDAAKGIIYNLIRH